MKSPCKVDTTPTKRLVGNKVVVFYSPAQIEFIVPVTKRLPASHGSTFDVHAISTGKRGVSKMAD